MRGFSSWQTKGGAMAVAGLLGTAYALVALGSAGVWYAALFAVVAVVGVAMAVEARRATAAAMGIASVTALALGVGRALVYGPTNPLAVVLVLLAGGFGWQVARG